MPVQPHYRLCQSTVGLVCDPGGRKQCLTLPASALVQPLPGPPQDTLMMDVRWNGRVVSLFAQDFRERATLVPHG